MTTYYNINPKFYVSVDCIIFGFDEGELKLLLLKRNFEPAMGKWSLMGGFVQEDESVDAAAKRVLAELTGLEKCIYGTSRHIWRLRARSRRTSYISSLLCFSQCK